MRAKTKAKKGKVRKPSRKAKPRAIESHVLAKQALKAKDGSSIMSTVEALGRVTTPSISLPTRPVFTIDVGSINGETTIGDLIVAFPRTRDVLMKHGLRFDVEQAGYLYMTLGVFSAIHGLTTNSLVQELHVASKEPPPQAAVPQLRPIAATTID